MSRRTDLIMNNMRREVLHTLHPLQTFFFEINSKCNLNCKHCYIPQQFKHQTLPFMKISDVTDEIFNTWGNSVGIAITGGEPLLHPDFQKITTLLSKYKFNWSLATNGLLLTSDIIDTLIQKGCNAITVSLDGNEKTHEIQRGKVGIYKKVLDIVNLLINKKFPNIYLTATIHDDNIQSLDDLYTLILKYDKNVKWRINPLLYCDNVKENQLKISEDTYTKLSEFVQRCKEDVKTTIFVGEKNPLALRHKEYLYSEFDSCFAGVSTFGILSNGDIVNCMVCRDKVLGTLNKKYSLKEIWENEDLVQKGLCERHLESKNSLYGKI